MRIVVTGANGFVGTTLCQFLTKAGHQVTTITRSPFTLPDCTNLVIPHPAPISSLDNQDCFIHLAARTHHLDESKAVLDIYRRDNVALSCYFAQLAIDAGAKRFIYISSIKVNGEETTRPFRHNDTPAPQDAYGISKWEAECQLKDLLAASKTALVVIRPPLIFGENPKGNLKTLLKLINKGVPLPFKNINNKRDIISVENLCSLISATCDHPGANGEVFLASDGKPRSTAQIIQMLERQSCRKAKLVSIPNTLYQWLGYIPPLKPKIQKLTGNLEVDISHTRQTLNWSPKD
ncbi:NAD-dependent epimerase/dehydratase family protein [Cellvibrio sp. ARAG 10.3]|uniref:NAD-dependent epimerase/dehydratase family protein n=1 Tax=Cellvibrio sp. ARAG 10.3 TaxID=3451358 RepID=UPI003F490436